MVSIGIKLRNFFLLTMIIIYLNVEIMFLLYNQIRKLSVPNNNYANV